MKFLDKINLKNRQNRVNQMFEEEGLTDDILREQLEINRKRHENDIHDPDEVVFTDENGKQTSQI